MMKKTLHGEQRDQRSIVVWETGFDRRLASETKKESQGGHVVPFRSRPQKGGGQVQTALEPTVTEWTVAAEEGQPKVTVTMISSGFGRMAAAPTAASPRSCAA
ncbi:MAG: hypothetical protein H0Z34_09765 [Brevibacillus sp.]|nr:hypothetical protein [Brevibacillus sp.]